MPPAPLPRPGELLAAYTAEVLNFSISGPPLPQLKACSAQEIEAFIARSTRLVKNSGAQALVLLGVGEGAPAMQLQAALPDTEILACEASPQRAQEACAQGHFSDTRPLLLADVALRARWLLARAFLAEKKFITCLNPELQGEEAEDARALQRLLQFCPKEERLPAGEARLGIYVITHPAEPDLESFLAHIPDWAAEVVLLWDAAAPPEDARELAAHCPAPLRQAARPLQGDFAAQRNYALSLCSAPWVFTLDADERLAPEIWERLREELTAPRAAAYLLPRLTLYPDERHFRVGYGLWPDPQLRLFRREDHLRYVNPVHEVLTGFSGNPVLLPHAAITHLSYVLKNRAELSARLEVFNRAAGREAHFLNENFPYLPLAWHKAWQQSIAGLTALPLLLKA